MNFVLKNRARAFPVGSKSKSLVLQQLGLQTSQSRCVQYSQNHEGSQPAALQDRERIAAFFQRPARNPHAVRRLEPPPHRLPSVRPASRSRYRRITCPIFVRVSIRDNSSTRKSRTPAPSSAGTTSAALCGTALIECVAATDVGRQRMLHSHPIAQRTGAYRKAGRSCACSFPAKAPRKTHSAPCETSACADESPLRATPTAPPPQAPATDRD